MSYFNYFIKCIIRNITKFLCKPKVILFLAIILALLIIFNLKTYAAEPQDTDVGVISYYNGTLNDVQNRLNLLSDTQFNNLKERILSGYFGVWAYYSSSQSTDVVSPVNWTNTVTYSYVNLILYNKNSISYTPNIQEPSYFSYSVHSGVYTLTGYIYSFSNNSVQLKDFSEIQFIIPDRAFSYTPNNFFDYFRDNSEQNKNDIVSAIQSSTNTITDEMTSTDFDDSAVDINTSSSDSVSDTEINGLFTTIFNNFSSLLSSSSWDEPSTIEVPLPHTEQKIILTSDILSKIVGTGFIYTFIETAWYFLFGLYVFKFVNKIIHSIKSGDILGGLSLDNEVITSSML